MKRLKASKLVMVSFAFLLIFGCLTPFALAKPKTNYIKAIGKGMVTVETTTIPARVLIEAFVTPGGYTTEYSIY